VLKHCEMTFLIFMLCAEKPVYGFDAVVSVDFIPQLLLTSAKSIHVEFQIITYTE